MPSFKGLAIAAGLALSVLGASPTGGLASAAAADLKVDLTNLRTGEGTVYIALYQRPEDFPQEGKGIAGQYVRVADGRVQVTFLNLKPGRYAVSAFHDENGNGHLDTNPMGVPVERFGFSRDAQGNFGPPSFDDAAIDLSADTEITIQLH